MVTKKDTDTKATTKKTTATKATVKKYGLKAMADYKCRLVENSFEGLQLNIHGHDVWTRLVGSFNAYNL